MQSRLRTTTQKSFPLYSETKSEMPTIITIIETILKIQLYNEGCIGGQRNYIEENYKIWKEEVKHIIFRLHDFGGNKSPRTCF